MTLRVDNTSFQANLLNTNTDKKQEKKEKAAAAIGGTAGAATTASRMASKRGMQAAAAEANAGEGILASTLNRVAGVAKKAEENSKVVNSLWGKFVQNSKMYAQDLMKRLEALKDAKIIGKIVKSPIAKGAASVAGGALAFFALVTGLNKAFRDGSIVVNDMKSKIADFTA